MSLIGLNVSSKIRTKYEHFQAENLKKKRTLSLIKILLVLVKQKAMCQGTRRYNITTWSELVLKVTLEIQFQGFFRNQCQAAFNFVT